MIGRREILDIAAITRLTPHIIEKDYALGWTLAGIFSHKELAPLWVFKGGTCLKKCYFETYRISEDLDFTLLDASHLNAVFLARCFADIGEWIYEQSGLEFPANSQAFDVYENSRGKLNCEAKLSYRVRLTYQDSTPTIEPYSLRQTRDGDLVLHTWNVDHDAHHSYRVDRIRDTHITARTFAPRYAIELTPPGPLAVQQTKRESSPKLGE